MPLNTGLSLDLDAIVAWMANKPIDLIAVQALGVASKKYGLQGSVEAS